ncbi:MAG: GNAT family N-acetyltransferase [Methanobacteriota archaeon]|nr:MAG: GNAT family N-acetyltransferase [Euryarchaeota archaeon]
MAIREFTPADMQPVMRIVKASLGETYPPSLYLTIHNIWPSGFLVLEVEGRIEAFVAAVESEKNVVRVLMLAVTPEHRGRSFGSLLMKELHARCIAAAAHMVKLEVRKSNSSALSFYERLGYSVVGELQNFYLNGEGAYVMRKTLGS